MIQGDLLDPQSLRRAFKGVDHVYHSAAHISIQANERKILDSVNIEGTRNVIEACQCEGVSTLVYFSSIHALDQTPQGQEVSEDNELISSRQRGGDYDYSKAMAEKLVREKSGPSLGTRIIYPTAVIGPNDLRLSLFGQAILKMAEGRLPALVDGGYDWVDARDVAWGAVEAAETGAENDRYILSGHYLGLPEVADIIANFTGIAAPGFTCPVWLARLAAPLMGFWAHLRGEMPLYTQYSLSVISENKVISHALATQRLGYQPRPVRSSMTDALRSYSEQGQLRVNQDGI
jgi:dihydroflavonol-4-reductase